MPDYRSKVYYLFTIALLLVIVSPDLFSEGMFMDGILYAAISNNLANGIGSFWQPYLSYDLFVNFYEHPPLVFGLQGLFFKVFGESMYVERFYCLLTLFSTLICIVLLWKEFTKSYHTAWFPVLLWGTVSVVSWSYVNNMLENTMTVFVCISVYLLIRYFKSNQILLLISGGVALSLAVLTKGFVCLYIWALPFFCWAIIRKPGFLKMVWDTCMLIAFTVLPILLLYTLSEAAANNMYNYFEKQVVGSIQDVVTVNSRFAIFGRFLQHVIAPLVIAVVILILSRKLKNFRGNLKENRLKAIVLALLVLSGIIPITISLKQRAYYIVSVYPFFALALAYWLKPFIEHILTTINQRQFKIIRLISYSLAVLALFIILFANRFTGRDKELIADAKKIVTLVGNNRIVGACEPIRYDFSLQGYLARFGNVGINSRSVTRYYNRYLLVKPSCQSDNFKPEKYTELDIGLSVYRLFERIEPVYW